MDFLNAAKNKLSKHNTTNTKPETTYSTIALYPALSACAYTGSCAFSRRVFVFALYGEDIAMMFVHGSVKYSVPTCATSEEGAAAPPAHAGCTMVLMWFALPEAKPGKIVCSSAMPEASVGCAPRRNVGPYSPTAFAGHRDRLVEIELREVGEDARDQISTSALDMGWQVVMSMTPISRVRATPLRMYLSEDLHFIVCTSAYSCPSVTSVRTGFCTMEMSGLHLRRRRARTYRIREPVSVCIKEVSEVSPSLWTILANLSVLRER